MSSTFISRAVATFGFVGYLKPAPGTWGSLAAVIVAMPIVLAGAYLILAIGASVAFLMGLWATRQEAGPEDHDPSRIVIDEVAGQWVALLPLAWLYSVFSVEVTLSLDAVIAAAIALGFFRVFDILKPWPVSWADRRKDAMGVMLDDVIAGAMAAICCFAVYNLIAAMDVAL
ncbi:MAG: phosphatidylglycerophosphatase A [Pseudomonadota bacterium]